MRFYYEHIFIIKKNSFEDFTSSIYGQSVNIFIINGLIGYTISLDNKRCDLYIKNPFSTVNFLLKNNIFNIPYCENFDFYTYYYFFAFQYAIYHGQPLFVHYNENNNDHEYYVENLYNIIINLLPTFDKSDCIYIGTLFELKDDLSNLKNEIIKFNIINTIG
jgi:hypothetical protein